MYYTFKHCFETKIIKLWTDEKIKKKINLIHKFKGVVKSSQAYLILHGRFLLYTVYFTAYYAF